MRKPAPAPCLEVGERFFGAPAVFFMELFQIFLRHIFDGGETILGAANDDDELGELELERESVPILAVLKEEDHQKRDDRGCCIDNELPGVAVVKQRSGK